MKNRLKDSNLYLAIAFVTMATLFLGSSQAYEQQSQVGLLDRLLSNHLFEEQLKNILFQYVDSEVSIQASGYSRFIEFFIRRGAHFSTYFLLGDSWFIGLAPRTKGPFLTTVVPRLAVTGYVGLDEFHQMITGGRISLFQGAMLDAMDASTAIVICLVVHGLRRDRRRRR